MDWSNKKLLMFFYFGQQLGEKKIVRDWNVTNNRGLGSVSSELAMKDTNYTTIPVKF